MYSDIETRTELPKILVCIFTLNEQEDLPTCLTILTQQFSDILILDSGSEDNTLEIAKSYKCKTQTRIQSGNFNFAEQRNWLLSNQKDLYDYILFIDADEIVPERFHEEIVRVINDDRYGIDCYEIPLLYRLHGRNIKSMGFPNWHDRLVKPTVVFSGGSVGEYVAHGKKKKLSKLTVTHDFNSKGIDRFFRKQLNYSRYVAEAMTEKSKETEIFDRPTFNGRMKRLTRKMGLIKPLLRFLYHYFARLGILEGRPGFLLACHMAIYEYLIEVNRIEILRKKKGLKL